MEFFLSLFDIVLWANLFNAVAIPIQLFTSLLVNSLPAVLNVLSSTLGSILPLVQSISDALVSAIDLFMWFVNSSILPVLHTAVLGILHLLEIFQPVFEGISTAINALTNFIAPVVNGFASIMSKIIKFFGG